MAPMIVARELYREFRTPKRYPGFLGSIRTLFTREYNVVRAVDHVSFSIERGELVGYIGPNGADLPGAGGIHELLSGHRLPGPDGRNPFQSNLRLPDASGGAGALRPRLLLLAGGDKPLPEHGVIGHRGKFSWCPLCPQWRFDGGKWNRWVWD